MGASEPDVSELFGAQHRVDEIHERRDAQYQRQQGHDVTYTRSHNATKPSIAANAANPSPIIPSINIASVLH
jgi:hypothetical protein